MRTFYLFFCSFCLFFSPFFQPFSTSLRGGETVLQETESFSELPLQKQYVRLLEPWIRAALTEIRFLSDDTAAYGLAQSGHWYMQAHDTAFTAFAVLGTDPNTDETRTGVSRERMREIALAMLRYTLRSHLAGGGVCTDDKPWGHSWISALGLERMTVGIDALDAYLDPELRTLYAKVCASEADYLCETPVKAGLTKDNHPESNEWSASVIWRAAVLNPEDPRVPEWKEGAAKYWVNAISYPRDAENETVVDGKPVKERFVGANMYDCGGCNHHGYENVGYMYITHSNLAFQYFSLKKRGLEPPEALFHHALEQWRVMKACTFPDGRLARIGGDSRVRYCYCQDYAVCVWLLVNDAFGDSDAEAFERGWLGIVRREQAANLQSDGSGWFMAGRLQNMRSLSPLYFQRLEGDKACTLACGAYWRRMFDFEKKNKQETESAAEAVTGRVKDSVKAPDSWQDEYHGAYLQRGERRFASWVWRGAMLPTGLCVPTDRSDLAEWQYNLSGQVFSVGTGNAAFPQKWTGYTFGPGGFITCGACDLRSTGAVAEGDNNPDAGRTFLAYCALPDDRTVVVIQKARTECAEYLRRVRALALSIPNDVLNDFSRTYFIPLMEKDAETPDPTRTPYALKVLKALPAQYEEVKNDGHWLNVENRLGVVEIYGGSPKIARLPERQIPLVIHGTTPKPGGGYLYCDEISQEIFEATPQSGAKYYPKRATIYDCAAVILTSDAEETQSFSDAQGASRIPMEDVHLRAVKVRGGNGKTYFILVNFSDNVKTFTDAQLSAWFPGAKAIHEDAAKLEPLAAGVWEIQTPEP